MCGVEWAEEINEYEVYDYPTLNCLVFVSEGKITEYVLSNTWTRVNSDFFQIAGIHSCNSLIVRII